MLENPKESTQKLIELINKFTIVAGNKINTQNQLCFYTPAMNNLKEKWNK